MSGVAPELGFADCERERLHLSGQIQPHGALLRLGADLRVTHASANTGALLGFEPEALLGQPLPASLGIESVDELAARPPTGFPALRLAACGGPGRRYDLALSPSGDGWLLEFEPAGEPLPPLPFEMREAMRHLRIPSGSEGAQTAFTLLTQVVAQMTGYGRVLLYRFAEDWSGEVVAETLTAPVQSYLGLHFPASDIPAIARDLYLRARQRFILDAEAAQVPVFSAEAVGPPPDQTFGDLRSVSPAHCAYLVHMGVRSSCSVSVQIRGRLWGLIACHHPEPRLLDLAARERLVSISRDFGIGLLAHLAGTHLKFIDGIEREVRTLLRLADGGDGLGAGLARESTRFLRLVGADSGAALIGDTLTTLGDAPSPQQIDEVVHWLAAHPGKGFAATDRLPALWPAAHDGADRASGVIALRVGARGRHPAMVLMWFRVEWPREVHWAGDPNKPGGGAGPLTPRQSFEAWVETARGRARPWELPDLLAAKTLRAALYRHES